MNRERMTEMIALLESVEAGTAALQAPEGNFNAVPVPVNFDMSIFVERDADCGTAACAWGHAPFHPPFIAQGVTLGDWGRDGYLFTPEFYGEAGFRAAEQFFEISRRISDYLFMLESYRDVDEVTPLVVANRIRELLAEDLEPVG